MFHHHSPNCSLNKKNSNSNTRSYSMMFSNQNGGLFEQNGEDYDTSSVVDCTLSLGTPSTRLCEEDEKRRRSTSYGGSSRFRATPYSNVPSFSSVNPIKATRGCSCSNGGGESLLARRCANCDTTSTPVWRTGPRGPKSLCNACGIHFKTKERRTTAASGNTVVGSAPVAVDQYGHHNANNNSGNSWAHHTTQRVPCNYPANGITFMNDYDGSGANNVDPDGGVPFFRGSKY